MTEKLEDLTASKIWEDFAGSQIPPVQVTGVFARKQLQKSFVAGLWTMFKLEERCRTETPERTKALFDQWRNELEGLLISMDAEGTAPDC